MQYTLPKSHVILPAFIYYDCSTHTYTLYSCIRNIHMYVHVYELIVSTSSTFSWTHNVTLHNAQRLVFHKTSGKNLYCIVNICNATRQDNKMNNLCRDKIYLINKMRTSKMQQSCVSTYVSYCILIFYLHRGIIIILYIYFFITYEI